MPEVTIYSSVSESLALVIFVSFGMYKLMKLTNQLLMWNVLL